MITTVCMNPSFDKTAVVDRIVTGGVNRLRDVRYDVGGKGINVAIVSQRLNINVTCVGCLGTSDEQEFMDMVRQDNLTFRYLRLPGKTRTNMKILDLDTKAVTEFNEPGLSMDAEQLTVFLELLKSEASESRFVVLSGRLPIGCPDDTYQRCMAVLPGKSCILDAAGNPLLLGLKEKPYLIKPNLPELEALMGKELKTLRAIRDAALIMIQYGAQNVIVSMGKYGAIFTDGKHTLFAPALSVEARSTVGAGDAMIGGVLMGLDHGETLEDSLRYGVAAGAASVMTNGTQLITVHDFEALLPKVNLQEL
ncbi:MAG TPA: 1-phosphofructokinase family hexose kinase [Candidatus Limiplasma sp.]|nr:1-phosphofructokinase family hexose kinase [Candidatus Limiplasma sp.]